MGERFYNMETGSFLSPDSLGHSVTPDLYSYAKGDPINFVDPTGRGETSAHEVSPTGKGAGDISRQEELAADLRKQNAKLRRHVNRLQGQLKTSNIGSKGIRSKGASPTMQAFKAGATAIPEHAETVAKVGLSTFTIGVSTFVPGGVAVAPFINAAGTAVINHETGTSMDNRDIAAWGIETFADVLFSWQQIPGVKEGAKMLGKTIAEAGRKQEFVDDLIDVHAFTDSFTEDSNDYDKAIYDAGSAILTEAGSSWDQLMGKFSDVGDNWSNVWNQITN